VAKIHILCLAFFFSPKDCAVHEITWKKYGTARQVTDDIIMPCRKDAICLPGI